MQSMIVENTTSGEFTDESDIGFCFEVFLSRFPTDALVDSARQILSEIQALQRQKNGDA